MNPKPPFFGAPTSESPPDLHRAFLALRPTSSPDDLFTSRLGRTLSPGGRLPPSLDTIQQLAPDQASLKAAGSLLKPAKWPLLARGANDLVWGECQGSGSSPYRVCATLDDLGNKCTCPSRKLPCKHALALLWIAVDRSAQLREAPVPDWVEEWLSRRRKRGSGPIPRSDTGDKDIAAALAGPEEPGEDDAKRAAAAAKAAEKRREDREAAVLSGLDDLERWLGDVLGEGLGAFPAKATERCRRIASRLVDAKAGGLATRLDELPGALFALAEEDRPAWLLGELGRVALLVKAYRRQEALPADLREDVRRLVGWATQREAVLEDPAALRVADAWTVLGARAVTQTDRLIRHETWLRRHGDGAPDFALMLDYVPVTGGSAPAYRAGEVLRAELVFFRSATPLRALLASRDPIPPSAAPTTALHGGHDGLDAAFAAAQRCLARNPWLEPVPVVVRGATLGRLAGHLVLTTRDAAFVPILDATDAAHFALGAAGPSTVALLLEPTGARLLAADTPLGWWEAP